MCCRGMITGALRRSCRMERGNLTPLFIYVIHSSSTVSELAFSYDMVIVPIDGEGVPELVFYVNAIHIYFEPRI